MRSEQTVTSARHRRATEIRRPSPKQALRTRILIVCEGSKSEPHYFDEIRLRNRTGVADIQICGKECGSAPISVVDYAEKRWHEAGKDFDQIFCVFDRDRHESFDHAMECIRALSKHGFKAIDSTPSFEYWLLLHFGYTRKSFVAQGSRSAGDVLEKELNNHFLETFGVPYQKGMKNVFTKLQDRTAAAEKSAWQALADASQTHEPNPSTRVHELVAVLLGQSNLEKNK